MSVQLSLFEYVSPPDEIESLWDPRDIWLQFTSAMVSRFVEDKRVEYKAPKKPHFQDLAIYLSMYSNTIEGGCLVLGVSDNGSIFGCKRYSSNDLNQLEGFHLQFCPQSKPEIKRIAVKNDDGEEDFLICIYVPYIGVLVETNKGEAYIRYGDKKHKMSEEERQDFRSTRQQRTFELQDSTLAYPADFDLEVIQLICDGYREREGKPDWTNEEVLIDRLLLKNQKNELVSTNALALLAARQPRFAIPGCRIRVQRFKGKEEGAGDTFKPLRDTYVEGNIIRLLERIKDVIDPLNYDVTWLDRNGKFQTTQEYPFHAWYEAVVNSLVHRSYSFSGSEVTVKFFADRLEIESPGGFMPPVRPENVLNQRASRNANICEALRYVGYTRMSREGTRRMFESMKAWSLPAPIFSEETNHGVSVKVILKNDIVSRERTSEIGVAKYCGEETWRTLQDYEIQIVAYAFKNEFIHVNEASRITGRTWNTSKKDLERLTRKGLLEFIEPRFQRDPKAGYRISEGRISSRSVEEMGDSQ